MSDDEIKIISAKSAIGICRCIKSCENCSSNLKKLNKEPCKIFGELYGESMWNYK